MKPLTARITTLSSIDPLSLAGSIHLTLPYPTSVNRIWRYDRGRVHLSDEYKAWIKEAYVSWVAQRRSIPIKRINGRYVLEVLVYPPDSRRRDVGNLEKAVSDFLKMPTVNIIKDDYLAKWVKFEWADPPYTSTGIDIKVTPYP